MLFSMRLYRVYDQAMKKKDRGICYTFGFRFYQQ